MYRLVTSLWKSMSREGSKQSAKFAVLSLRSNCHSVSRQSASRNSALLRTCRCRIQFFSTCHPRATEQKSSTTVDVEKQLLRSSVEKSCSTVDVDKELLRYNVEEFYPENEVDNDDEEYEDFEVHEQADKSNLVDEELAKYNIDEFYGIELEEQHIKPITKDERFANLPFDLERSDTGVFHVGELCDLLRAENMYDVCALALRPELGYVDHMVIASGISKRHLRAVAMKINQVYKRKRSARDKPTLHMEGYADRVVDEWLAIDMGNMVVHLMLEDARFHYDFETLWTCGAEFDIYQQKPTEDQFVLTTSQEAILDEDHDKLFQELSKVFEKKEEPAVIPRRDESQVPTDYRFGSGTAKWTAKLPPRNLNDDATDDDTDEYDGHYVNSDQLPAQEEQLVHKLTNQERESLDNKNWHNVEDR